MPNIEAEWKIKREARARMRTLSFGDPVTNVCTGDANPWHHAYFVKIKGDSLAQVTDKKGKFGNFGCEVIYPGHLSIEKSKELFEPFWQAQFGERPSSATEGR